MRSSMLKITLFFLTLANAALMAGELPPPPRPLDYPNDLRMFRKKALQHDGILAPDIGFAVRTCPNPNCGKPYVCGTYPRMKRQPLESLDNVRELLETALKKDPPKTMYSARVGHAILRSCPVCLQAENGGRAEKVFFCHVIPESGDDIQIEYEVHEQSVVPKTFWIVKRLPSTDNNLPEYADPVLVNLKDLKEDTLKNAFGQHFSLRAVWNEIFAANMEGDKVVYQNVSPGLYFVFRPKNVSNDDFRKFADTQLKPDRENGLFTRLEPVLVKSDSTPLAGTYKEWAPAYEVQLSAGGAECFVGVSFPELRKAASEVMASRSLRLDIPAPSNKSEAGSGVLMLGELNLQVDLAPIAAQAALHGTSLHQACALYLTEPAFALEGAQHLSAAIRKRFPDCTFDIMAGHTLVLTDTLKQKRKVDVGALADKLDPENKYMFDLFCSVLLPWDDKKKAFGAEPIERQVSPVGLPALLERRIRPAGFLHTQDKPSALFEPREDAGGKRYDLCYTSECSQTVVYVDPSKPRFKDMTLDEVQRLYELMAGALPTYIELQDSLSFPGNDQTPFYSCKVELLAGLDLSSLASDNKRATELANVAGMGDKEGRIHCYAFSSNSLVLSPRKLSADELKLAHSRMNDMLGSSGVEPGLELNLHLDLARGEARGIVLRRGR